MKEYHQLKNDLCRGWQTWNNTSVLSHIHMPEGIGINLGLKDYKAAKSLSSALIGQRKEEGIVTPYAHAYDGSYTSLKLDWQDNSILVDTAQEAGNLLIRITPLQQPLKPSSLIIEGVSLWNIGGTISRKDDTLLLQKDSLSIPVYTTEADNNELFVWCKTPYLSVSLTHVIGISTGKYRTLAEIEVIIDKQRGLWEKNKGKYGHLSEAYNAMQTCQAWDTIYNPQEAAPVTTVSRIWNNNWGGYVLFCWDTYFAALMQAVDNKRSAYCNAVEITHSITPEGFVPNYSCQNLFKSYDRSQPPVGSTVCLMIYQKYRDAWFLEEVFNDLLQWNEWFLNHRRTKNGLLAWGSDPYIGDTGHALETEGVHDRLGAAYESGLDNSPMYDDIPFDKERNILLLEDVGLTGLYIKDCYSLSEIASILGRREAADLLDRAHQMEENMETLWNEDFGMYLNRREDTGEFEYRLSPFHFHALFSKKVGPARAERIIREHLYNPEEFWGTYILPSIAKNDPAYPEQVYWRGRIWAPMNFLVYLALLEYPSLNYADRKPVRDLAQKSEQLILKEWMEMGHVHENYDCETGEGCNSPRSDKFYHWGGLLSFIALHEAGMY